MEKDPLAKLKVLVADLPYMATLTGSMLRTLGIKQVTEVNDSAALERALERNTYDVVIVDDAIAPTDAIDITRTLRASEQSPNRHVPLLMTFTVADKGRVITARDAGVTEFLIKPLSANVIGLRLTQTLANPRAFVAAEAYVGPDRRRKTASVKGPDRRKPA